MHRGRRSAAVRALEMGGDAPTKGRPVDRDIMFPPTYELARFLSPASPMGKCAEWGISTRNEDCARTGTLLQRLRHREPPEDLSGGSPDPRYREPKTQDKEPSNRAGLSQRR